MCVTQHDILDYIKEKGQVSAREIFNKFSDAEECNNWRKLKRLKTHKLIDFFENVKGERIVEAIE
jgi:hypothetical protein